MHRREFFWRDLATIAVVLMALPTLNSSDQDIRADAVPTAVAVDAALESTPHIEALDAQRFRIAGQVLVDRGRASVVIPAEVNQRRGLVEYLLVQRTGKRHEAVFTTGVQARDLHVACLLLGVDSDDADRAVPTLTVQWQRHGPAAELSPQRLLVRATPDGEPTSDPRLSTITWRYLGSRFTADGFAADVSGSLITLQRDDDALLGAIDLPPGELVPLADQLPAIGTPVSLILRFITPASTRGKEHQP